ncbi:MAG: phosphoglycerate dehydrogenase [Phycisphaerales bacterium]|nr:phosphoglycerate dehydrogenase [Phycisphaerales bacterium]
MSTSFPKSQIRIVLLEGVHDAAREMLERDGFDVEHHAGALDERTLLERCADAHVVGIRSKTHLPSSFFGEASRLLAVGCFCIGTNQVDLGAARVAGVPVFNSPFSNTRSVAELTIAEIIGLHRKLADRSASMHEGRWQKSASGAHEVRGRVLGIVGYGHIGAQVSVLAEAIGMQVQFFDLVPKLAMGNARQVASLRELLETSDVVTLHVPATDQTTGMLGASELGWMKPGTYVINNARGSVVDLEALASSIRSGHLAGAALDVFPEEPKKSGDPFDAVVRGLPNVILTPHIGGSTQEAQEAIARDVASKMLRFVNNGSTTGAVNVPEVDLPEQKGAHRILHMHRNVPGVLSKMHRAIADLGVNITGEYLRTDEQVGYVVLEVAPAESEPILHALRGIEETIRLRLLW